MVCFTVTLFSSVRVVQDQKILNEDILVNTKYTGSYVNDAAHLCKCVIEGRQIRSLKTD